MYRLEFPAAAGGETYLQSSDLINAVLLGCFRGGPEVMTIKTAGAPVGNEVKFTAALGRIDFDPANPLIATELVTVQYRPQ